MKSFLSLYWPLFLPVLPLGLFVWMCLGVETAYVDRNRKISQQSSVTVKVTYGDGHGSGVVVHRDGVDYVWTAGHVVEDAEKVETVLDPQTWRPVVKATYKPVKVVREIKLDSEAVGEQSVEAEIIRYSDIRTGNDLALLRVKSPAGASAKGFEQSAPKVGSPVYHVGSPFTMTNSYIKGHVAGLGRENVLGPGKLDQYSLPITGGSSGGPIFDQSTDKVVGLVTQNLRPQPTICMAVPSRVIWKFAREHKCLWAVDPKAPVENVLLASPRTTPLPLPPEWRVAPAAPILLPFPFPG